MKGKKRLSLILAVCLVVVALGFYLLTNNKNDAAAYRTEKVDRGDVIISISATGTVNPDTIVQVGSQVSGRIAKLYADFNSVVTRGQLLAQLDPTFLQAALDQARAGVTRARASLNQAQRDFGRTRDLFAKSLVSQADMDAATTNLESSQASLEQAQAAYEGAEVNLRYATIRSPIAGVVISRNVDVGQTVAASLSAPTLFEIANDLRKMQVRASVDEADIGNVKVGQDVTFRVDAFPDEEFRGTVSQIRLAPIVSQNVVTYTVIIGVDNSAFKLMPGMTATVTIQVARSDDALRVPLQAIRFTPPESELRDAGERRSRMAGGEARGASDTTSRPMGFHKRQQDPSRAVVWVLNEGKPKPVRITKGIQTTRYVEVREGDLKEGDDVITGMSGVTPQTQQQMQNPFAPQMPRGGGRRGGF
jgi:HlyD family secretion protein